MMHQTDHTLICSTHLTVAFLLLSLLATVTTSQTSTLVFLGQTPFKAYVSRAAPPRQTLYQFFAVDSQGGGSPEGVTYSLEQGSGLNTAPFSIGQETGRLENLEYLPLTPLQYELVVEANLQDVSRISTNISVIVTPESDSIPRFEHNQYEVSISEGLTVDSPFTVIRAFSFTSTTHHYSIVGGNTDGDIAINSDTGVMKVDRALDRERTSSYSLTVRYVEDITSIDTNVEIEVLDENDHSPQFGEIIYNVTVNEDIQVNSLVLTVSATDPDLDENGHVFYSLDSNVASTFSLDELTGEIRAIVPLDYERKPQYQFTVSVTDGGMSALSTNVVVFVNLLNVDDECPRFENPIFVREIPYDPEDNVLPTVGMEVLTVVASDPDKFSSVTYVIISGNEDGVLALDATTGLITLAVVSSDPRGQYNLNVSASDQSCANESFVGVEIGIGNVNDHSPQFQTDCTAELEENPPTGTEIITLVATDEDIGSNGQVTYTLLTNKDLFTIDPANGVVRTTSTPGTYNRENQSLFQVGVTATDGGNRQDYCLLVISLLDQNDNPPMFHADQYTTTRHVSSPPGTFIVQVSANDVDLGDSGTVRYSLRYNEGSTEYPFRIDPQTGVITTNDTLPHFPYYLFDVVGTDQGSDPLSSAVLVNVTLSDGTAFPIFDELNYYASICENAGFPAFVVSVSATSTINEPIIYSILQGNDYHSNSDNSFQIGSDGRIFVSSVGTVDYEGLPDGMFQLVVRALNSAGSNPALVEVNVTDQDDNQPQFTSEEISVAVTEGEPIGTVISQLRATDDDSGTNGEIDYTLFSVSEYFDVSLSGVLTSKVEFDAENPPSISDRNIYVEAYNPNPPESMADPCYSGPRLSSTVLVRVAINDINDNPPEFKQSAYSFLVPESLPIQSSVGIVEATDKDASDLGKLMFSLQADTGGTFEMDPLGVLLLSQRLDYEVTKMYVLPVQVTDGTQTADAIVNVVVTDIDDNPPVFTSNTYSGQVVENAAVGTYVLTIVANDPDSTVISYELKGLAEGRFSVNETGNVTVAGPIDREEFPGGRVVFLAFAEGGGLATAEITISIADVNDYTPRFSEEFRGRVEENSLPGPEGFIVTEVRAVDLDEGQNGTVTYSLISGAEYGFRIDNQSGVITAHAEFDRETMLYYTLIVQGTDDGIPNRLSSTTEVIVDIGDENDNAPFFPFPYMFAWLFEEVEIGTLVLTIPTSDLDNGTNATVTYSIISTDPPEPKFEVNPNTGEVTVSGILDYEIPKHQNYILTLTIRDPMFQSELNGTLEIQLLDRNDNTPVILSIEYLLGGNMEVAENIPMETELVRINAKDDDSGSNGDLLFAITDGNTNEYFSVSADGVVRNHKKLDHETAVSYTLTILISDQGYPTTSTSVDVRFVITDVNDEKPAFGEDPYTASIPENSNPATSILQVLASDPDTGNGGAIASYRIVSGNERGYFGLDPVTGILETLDSFDREEEEEYVLTITAVDSGPAPLTGTGTIVITITDLNDSPSSDGGQLEVLFYALDGQIQAGNVSQVYFTDADVDDTFQGCFMDMQATANPFTVDETCTIQLSEDNPPEGAYNLNVQGNDGLHANVSATVTITVEYISRDLIPPSNILTVTLNTSAAAYLDTARLSFPALLADALGVSDDQLVVVSVRDGYHDPVNTVDITFSARGSTGSFLSPTVMLQDLYLKRDTLSISDFSIYALPTDPCAVEPCYNQAACKSLRTIMETQLVARSSQLVLFAPLIALSYECQCIAGTSGDFCEINFNDCYSNPCLYDAQCTDDVQGFTCDCPDGSGGTDCSFNPDECASSPCKNNATCQNGLGTYICTCLPGYYGDECQYSYFRTASTCTPNPCLNGGECSPGRDSYTCLCPPGFSGLLCEETILIQGGCIGNPCYNGSTCTDTPDGPMCTCSIGFTGPNCKWPLNTCELEPCRNGATCTRGLYGSYQCTCNPGYTGENCMEVIPACDSTPCMNGGRCYDNLEDGLYTCECTREYSGENCETPIIPEDLCAKDPNPCTPGSNCTYSRDSYTCTCPSATSGSDCSTPSPGAHPCDSNPCLHGSTCLPHSAANYTCTCSSGFTGTRCEININDCISDPCMNGGQCTDWIDGFICSCLDQISGPQCDVYCPDGHSGEFCEVPPDYCSLESCTNGGTCTEEAAGFTCVCTPSYTGQRCEIDNSCDVNECLNGGVCSDSENSGYECMCAGDFDGPNCELVVASFSGSRTLSSYRAFDSLNIRGRGTIRFQFATVDSDGLLLYNSQFQSGNSRDFITVEVVGGYLNVGVSHGGEEEGDDVLVMSAAMRVDDGEWHQVTIDTSGKVSVDNNESVCENIGIHSL